MAQIPTTVNVRELIKGVSSRSRFGASQSNGLTTTSAIPVTVPSRVATLTTTPQGTFACFHIDELVRGEQLESHRTHEVHEIRAIRQGHKEELPMHQHSRDCMTEQVNHVRNNRNKKRQTSLTKASAKNGFGWGREASPTTIGKRFVMKHIRKECMESQEQFEEAALALENEATMMKGLCHPSIPRLRGISLGGTEAYYCTGRHDAFFLVTDRIEESLQERVIRWRKRDAWLRWRTFHGLIRRRRNERAFLVERFRVALDIANGVLYMHEHGISHGSLESRSIGFNASDDVQILQLGKARKQSHSSPQPSSLSVTNQQPHLVEKQRPSKQLPSLALSTNSVTLSRNESERSCGTNSSHPSELQLPGHAKALGSGSSNGFQHDVLGYSKILCEILTMRSFGETDSFNHMSRQGKSYINEFRSLATKIPRCLLELLQRGLSDFAESRPTMREYCVCLEEVLFNMNQLNAQKESTRGGVDASTTTTSYSQCRQQQTRRPTQLGLPCEGGSEELKLMGEDDDDNFGENTELGTEWDGTTMSHRDW